MSEFIIFVHGSASGFEREETLIAAGVIPRSLLRNGNSWSSQSSSFPRVFSGNPGENSDWTPDRNIRGWTTGEYRHGLLIPPQLAAGGVLHSTLVFQRPRMTFA